MENLSNSSMDKVILYIVNIDEETTTTKSVSSHLKQTFIRDIFLGEHGKPLSQNKKFNISHTKNIVCMVVNDKHEIGVDIESYSRIIKDDVKKYFLSQDELTQCLDNKTAINMWVSKESILKCSGDGITKRLTNVPSLPFEGKKFFEEKQYYSKLFVYNDFAISITLNFDKEFDIEVKELVF